MPTKNSDKTILVTGCSSGIGKTVAFGLQALGYHVIATARSPDDIEKLNQANLKTIALDYSDQASVEQAFQLVMKLSHGKLYAVFHNGAYGQSGAVEDITREVLEKQFAANFFGWHQLNNLIIPVMRKQGYGRILINSSVLGLVALPMRGAYNASKYALEGLFDTLRLELHNTNIHISLIEPGPISSRFRDNSLKAFQANIDVENSPFRDTYKAVLKRLQTTDKSDPFTLPPEAVLKKVVHALQSPKPKVRYYVTFPTYLFATLKRVLPHRWLDAVLRRIGQGETKQ